MLYCLSGHTSNQYKYAVMDYDYYTAEGFVCGSCGREAQKLQLLSWPPGIRLEWGKRYPDHLSVSIPFEERCGFIVSEKALAVFQKAQLTGFEAAPLEIAGADSPRYYFLTVIGSVSLDYGAMHYRKQNVCPECGSFRWSRQKIGISVLDQESWDGADFCKLVDYPNYFLCTQKVVDVIKREKLKGFMMRQESEIFMPLKDVKIC